MVRLHVLTEGRTELVAVEDVLRPHLLGFGVYADARSVLIREHRTRYTPAGAVVRPAHRGGMGSYRQPRGDLTVWMKDDNHPDCHFTTMFDLYGLPADFPARAAGAKQADPYLKVAALEEALAKDLNHYRFIPYIQVHEFEALLLADPRQLVWEYMDHEPAIASLEQLVAGDQNPELIDEGRETAPSKRIIDAIPEYEVDKARVGPLVIGKIGIPALRAKCPHFGEWLCRLERLGTVP